MFRPIGITFSYLSLDPSSHSLRISGKYLTKGHLGSSDRMGRGGVRGGGVGGEYIFLYFVTTFMKRIQFCILTGNKRIQVRYTRHAR